MEDLERRLHQALPLGELELLHPAFSPHALAHSQAVTGHQPALSFHPRFGVSLFPWQNRGQLPVISRAPEKPLPTVCSPNPNCLLPNIPPLETHSISS